MKVRVLKQRAICFARDISFCFCSFRLRLRQQPFDCLEHFVHIGEHLIVPKSKYAIAARSEICCADFIVARSIRMLAAIYLDDNSTLDRAEIREVRTNRKLTAELYVADSSAAKMAPQDLLSRSLLAVQFARCFMRRFGRRHRFERFRDSRRENKALREPESGNRARGRALNKVPHLRSSPFGRGEERKFALRDGAAFASL